MLATAATVVMASFLAAVAANVALVLPLPTRSTSTRRVISRSVHIPMTITRAIMMSPVLITFTTKIIVTITV